jgi:predicted metalloprotease
VARLVGPLLVLALIAAACGSSGGSGGAARSGATSTSSSASTTSQAVAGHELDAFPSITGLTATKLPEAPTSAAVERTFLVAVFDDVQNVWRREFDAAHETYRGARLVVFYGQVHSGCGKHEGSGPFYCPGDDTVYLDLRFFSQLLNLARVGPVAQAYIVGHELGHHVQRLAGVAAHVAALNQVDPSGKNARSVQVELQADCLAGVWGRSMLPRSGFSATDLYDALKTAHKIGDDYIQKAYGNIVDTSLFTHGSSEQRRLWLRTGYKSGKPGSCDTFASASP